MAKRYMPKRWAFKHGAYYYRTRDEERSLFDGKSWFRLGTTFSEALRVFADRQELVMGGRLGDVIDRYDLEVLPKKAPNTQASYRQSLARLRRVLGQNSIHLIDPKLIYGYREGLLKAKKSMNVINNDLKVLNVLLDQAIEWAILTKNPIKGAVKYFGKRDGLKKERDRLVADWELHEWQKVASPLQKAFAAIALLTGARKSDILQIVLPDERPEGLRIEDRKNGKAAIYRWTPALREAVDMAKSIRTGDSMFLFTNRNGQCYVNKAGQCTPFDRAWVQSMDRAIADPANKLVERFTRHDLRAKVASDADTEQRAQQLLGHASPNMTRKHYRRAVPIIDPVR